MSNLSSRFKFAFLFICLMFLNFTYTAASKDKHEERIKKTFNVRSGQQLTLRSDRGSVSVEGWNREIVEVEVIKKTNHYSKREAERIFKNFEIDFGQTSRGLTIEGKQRDSQSWFRKFKNFTIQYMIKVPKEFDIDLRTSGGSIHVERIKGEVNSHTSGGSIRSLDIEGDVRLKTSGGSISSSEINGNLEARTSGGSIKASDVSGSVLAKTSGGGITLDTIGSYAKAYTSGGSLRLNAIGGHVDASTSGGSVYAEIVSKIDRPCSLKTSGGSITLIMPEDTQANIDASASGGRVRADIAVTVQGTIKKNKLQGTINGGGPLIYLRTSGGSITIKSK